MVGQERPYLNRTKGVQLVGVQIVGLKIYSESTKLA